MNKKSLFCAILSISVFCAFTQKSKAETESLEVPAFAQFLFATGIESTGTPQITGTTIATGTSSGTTTVTGTLTGTTTAPVGTPNGTTTTTPIGTPSGTTTTSISGTPTDITTTSTTGTPNGTTTTTPIGTPSGTTTTSTTGTPTDTTTTSTTGTPTGTTTTTPRGTPSDTTTTSTTGTPTDTTTTSTSGTPTDTTTTSTSGTPIDTTTTSTSGTPIDTTTTSTSGTPTDTTTTSTSGTPIDTTTTSTSGTPTDTTTTSPWITDTTTTSFGCIDSGKTIVVDGLGQATPPDDLEERCSTDDDGIIVINGMQAHLCPAGWEPVTEGSGNSEFCPNAGTGTTWSRTAAAMQKEKEYSANGLCSPVCHQRIECNAGIPTMYEIDCGGTYDSRVGSFPVCDHSKAVYSISCQYICPGKTTTPNVSTTTSPWTTTTSTSTTPIDTTTSTTTPWISTTTTTSMSCDVILGLDNNGLIDVDRCNNEASFKQQVQECCEEADGIFDYNTCTCCIGCQTTSTTTPWISTTTTTSMSCDVILGLDNNGLIDVDRCNNEASFKQQVQECCEEAGGDFEYDTCYCCIGCDDDTTTSPWITTTTVMSCDAILGLNGNGVDDAKCNSDEAYKQQVQECCEEADGVFDYGTCVCCMGCDCLARICESVGNSSGNPACQRYNAECIITTSPWITTTSCGGTECECLQAACEQAGNSNDPACIKYNEICIISTTSLTCETLLDKAPSDTQMCEDNRNLFFECCRDAGGVYEYDAEECYCCLGPGCTTTTSTIVTTTTTYPDEVPCCDETIP